MDKLKDQQSMENEPNIGTTLLDFKKACLFVLYTQLNVLQFQLH